MEPTITIVFSRHEVLGECNAHTQERIIAHLNPDVIFEELSEEQYKEAYELRTLNNLESVAIRNYTSYSKVPHIPVDTFMRPKNYNDVQDQLWNKLSSGAGTDYESFQLRSSLERQQPLICMEGFRFLNSDRHKKEIHWLHTLKECIVRKSQDSELRKANRRFNELIDKREETILNNILNYAKDYDLSSGLLLIGSAHCLSLTEKIIDLQKIPYSEIAWKLIDGRSLMNE